MKAQAIVQTCTDFRFRNALDAFLENELNLHSVAVKSDLGGIRKIFEEGPVREWIFENYRSAFDDHGIERVILINHLDCAAYGGSAAFQGPGDEISQHEIQLRHAVSVVRAKFPAKTVEAYLGAIDQDGAVSFRKVA